MKISATIITLDEERNIARAMESLRCCDEIVVVDSGSTDRTPEIAAKLGARVVDSVWPGYAKQKNYAGEQASNDWILSIDADEALSEALEGEIWQIKKSGPQFDALHYASHGPILGNGFCIRAGIRIAKCVCTTAANRSGWANMFMRA